MFNSIGIFLFGIGTAYAIKVAARKIAGYFNTNKEKIISELQKPDDWLELKVQAKFPNFKVSETIHNAYDSGVSWFVNWAGQWVGSVDFWKKLFAFAAKNPSQLPAAFIEKVTAWKDTVDWAKEITTQLPPELIPVINLLKHDKATTLIASKVMLNTSVPAEAVKPNATLAAVKAAVDADVIAAAALNKVHEDNVPITKESLEKLLEAHKKINDGYRKEIAAMTAK